MAGIASRISRLRFVTIWSRNLSDSKEFYIDRLGLKLLDEVENEFFQFEIGGVPACVDCHLERSGLESNQFGVETKNLNAMRAALDALRIPIREGQSAKEQWVAINDPDGHEIIFLAAVTS